MSRFNCNNIYPMNETEYGNNMNFIAIDIFFVLSPLSCCLRSANKVSNVGGNVKLQMNNAHIWYLLHSTHQ